MKTNLRTAARQPQWKLPAKRRLSSNGWPHLYAAQPADRVTDNLEQFRKRWRKAFPVTNFTEAEQ